MIKRQVLLIVISTAILMVLLYFLNMQNVNRLLMYEFSLKKDLSIKLSQVNDDVRTLSADTSNKLILVVKVRNNSGTPVPMADVSMSVTNNLGSFSPKNIRTDENGEFIVTYIPPALTGEQLGKDGTDITLKAQIKHTEISSTINLKLVRVPVIMVHGYFETSSVFDNMKEYLLSRGFSVNAMNFNSLNGIIASTSELDNYISQQKKYYLSNGFKVNKIDVITHSMGGLLARYYTCNSAYVFKDNIRKIIFISVPQKGSPWASIGTSYFKDQGIKDLIPDSPFLATVLPSLLNKGLNHNIQVGSIMVEYDEVVSPESASLSEWNIKTEVFNIGGNSFTMEMLFNGNLMQAPNHKNILSNKKAFDMVESMLNSNLPYPAVRK